MPRSLASTREPLPCRRRCSEWPLPSSWRLSRRWLLHSSSTGASTARPSKNRQAASPVLRCVSTGRSTRGCCRRRISSCATWRSVRPAASRRSAPAPSSLRSGLVRSCAVKCALPKCGLWRRKSVCGWTITGYSIGRCAARTPALKRSLPRASPSKMAGSCSAMRRLGRSLR